MADWNAQKMLDLYVYDYMIRKNMHQSAQNFMREAGVTPKTVEIGSAEGFLVEWWSLFWDVYTGRLAKNTRTTSVSPSEAIEGAENVLQNVRPVPPMPDLNEMMQLQNICAATRNPGLLNLLQTVNPTTMSMQDMENLLQSSVSMQRAEFDPNTLESTPVSDNNAKEEQTATSFIAERIRELQALPKLPPVGLDNNSHLLDVDQVAQVIPASISTSHSEKNANNKRPFSATIDGGVETSLRSTIARITPHAPKQEELETEETGMGGINLITPQRFSFAGVGRADYTQVNYQQKYAARFPHYTGPDLAAIGSSNQMVSPVLFHDGSKQKHLQIEKNTGKEKARDEAFKLFFSNDEKPR
ncbi:hypothetical protein ABFS82_13G105800 [Erythranthe guttata]